MYIIELSGLVWQYSTAEEAWNNKALEVHKNCPLMTGTISGVIFGVRTFEEFKRLLDEGKVLQYHALKVHKVG